MNNKILQIILATLLILGVNYLILCVFGEVAHIVNKAEEPKISSVDSLENVIDQKDSIIEEFEYQVYEMNDEIQMREAEISYWGRKYDSTMIVISKYKR